ncbi:uncharacterized protein LOC134267670 [Saccostrea cucullata]|uniref:uncharacterized protein LOC134267670 n=1 Tax=Saccostrea cuccullata TaxID=36930 RepID=UPI002ED02ADB
MWNKQDTKTLFDIRSRMEKDFNSNKVHKSLWETIAKELSAVGVTASATQCMNKWKALKREYKKTVDNNAQTGSEKKTCHFFEQFSELYGNKSGTRPAFTLSSRVRQNNKTENNKDNDEDVEAEDSRDSNSSDSSTPQPKKSLKRRNTNQSALLALEEYTKRQEEYRKERLFERFGYNLVEFYEFTKNIEDCYKDLHMFIFQSPKATECFDSPFSYCSYCSASPESQFSCEMSTKCFTPDTLLKETCFNVESDSSNIQIGNNVFVPTLEFHHMVNTSLEKWIDNI